ncbi:casein kinase II subunit beta'-like [Drosophila subobscura]|uniref:casein kinase II subunit beta'-like n=1 Tax=Drosophila subobscura TaxID=7241 RepID=UPI00155A65CA|nr:casein kinase II subunit beta'-like [Drosophila subobscura]
MGLSFTENVRSDLEETSWVRLFSKQRRNEFFVLVAEEFVRDKFNLLFLDMEEKNYRRSLDVIFNEKSESDAGTDADVEAGKLCGRIHARFILTGRGIELMYKKFQNCNFGTCSGVFCRWRNVLPIGMSDTPGNEMVRLFCPM